MGLCRCRKVTSLFCFQHRINVCDQCILTSHSTCVVRTYLQWLQDSDFDPSCKLCRQPLSNGDPVIRLTCLDAFHWRCLDNHARTAYPPNTAPAGFKCPTCKEQSIVPKDNDSSSIAKAAREILQEASWAYIQGPAADGVDTAAVTGTGSPSALDEAAAAALAAGGPAAPPDAAHAHSAPAASSASSAPSAASALAAGPEGMVSRKQPAPGPAPQDTALDVDAEENKYARRPTNAWFSRIVGNRVSARKPVEDPSSGLKKAAIVLILLVVGLITVIELLTRARPSGDADPLLDPRMNPNIRIDSDASA